MAEENSKYEIINKQLEGFDDREEIHLCDYEIDDLIGAVQMQVAYDSNVGYLNERVEYNERDNREFHFQQEWLKLNHPNSGYGYYGIIQALFNINDKQVVNITNRDRHIVATIIQWLGSNIGFCFLETALKKSGYVIQEQKNYDEQWEEVKKAREIIKKAKELANG